MKLNSRDTSLIVAQVGSSLYGDRHVKCHVSRNTPVCKLNGICAMIAIRGSNFVIRINLTSDERPGLSRGLFHGNVVIKAVCAFVIGVIVIVTSFVTVIMG